MLFRAAKKSNSMSLVASLLGITPMLGLRYEGTKCVIPNPGGFMPG